MPPVSVFVLLLPLPPVCLVLLARGGRPCTGGLTAADSPLSASAWLSPVARPVDFAPSPSPWWRLLVSLSVGVRSSLRRLQLALELSSWPALSASALADSRRQHVGGRHGDLRPTRAYLCPRIRGVRATARTANLSTPRGAPSQRRLALAASGDFDGRGGGGDCARWRA